MHSQNCYLDVTNLEINPKSLQMSVHLGHHNIVLVTNMTYECKITYRAYLIETEHYVMPKWNKQNKTINMIISTYFAQCLIYGATKCQGLLLYTTVIILICSHR